MNKITITTTHLLDDNFLEYFATQVHQAIGYWARVEESKYDYESDKTITFDEIVCTRTAELKRWVVTDAMLLKGCGLYIEKFPNRAHHILNNDYDIITLDIVIQLACFGELVYG